MDEEEIDNNIQLLLEEDAELDDLVADAFFDSSSDEEEKQWGGSRPGRAPNKPRDFLAAYNKLMADYFNGRESVYDEVDFARRFRMSRALYEEIEEAVMGEEPFIQKKDATGKLCIHPKIKLVACLRYIAYGDSYDREDENLGLAASTLHPIVQAFNPIVIEKLGPQYLNRTPTKAERDAISRVMASKGFAGLLASWDCKHFTWSNCPMRWSGSHDGHSSGKTLILEAIADHRKYVWYVNFGDAGAMNDINVLDKSFIIAALLRGELSLKTEECIINGTPRDWNYFLVDRIYPAWAIFVNSYQSTSDARKLKFNGQQEKVRKDIECAFGIIVQQHHVLKRPLRSWCLPQIRDLLHCCVILHNVTVVEKEGAMGNTTEDNYDDNGGAFALFGKEQATAEEAALDGIDLFTARHRMFNAELQNAYQHRLLKQDLMEDFNK